ncbi:MULTISPECIES: FxsA family protein [Vibrio]|uniref:Membrane protein FxsA n=1 Tax=Vibrio algicola TaxID=2662262 RepID=A0A5Q0TGU5_9VIBR|nr:FxsA family protein [Vibrio algicola]MBD1576046.1 membrane protein FxsA [Vibrio sp. S11_S32]
MFTVLLVLFICVPIVEITLFIQVGGAIGLWPTIAIVLTTAIVGASLVRSQGIQTLMSVQSRMQQGELPAQQIVEGVMLAVAGVLLLTPGFMTDFLGMVVLLPAPRAMLAKQLMKRVKVNPASGPFGGGFQSGGFQSGGFQSGDAHNPFGDTNQNQQGDVFEGEYEKKADQDKRLDK